MTRHLIIGTTLVLYFFSCTSSDDSNVITELIKLEKEFVNATLQICKYQIVIQFNFNIYEGAASEEIDKKTKMGGISNRYCSKKE